MPLNPDFKNELQKSIRGEVKDDFISRLLYSTDASIYQIEPLGVVFPQDLDDLNAIVEIANQHRVPLLARGSGSSLGGQAVGPALVIDVAKHLDRLMQIDLESKSALVEPGVILYALNRSAGQYGLMFGPDPASAERASIGGSIGCNATGAHSILYGMTADHLLSCEVVLSDGEVVTFGEESVAETEYKLANATPGSVKAAFYQTALAIRKEHGLTIQRDWPRVWRRASGYNLNYLLPWSPAAPPQWFQPGMPYPPVANGNINLAPLIAGSEGTLGIIRKARLRLVEKPAHTILGVLKFSTIAEACDQTPALLERNPSAIELIPGEMLRLARSRPAYARQVEFVQGEPEAMLVVEFSGDRPDYLREQAQALGDDVIIAETPARQNQVWGIRKMGLGILNSLAGDAKPLAFVEDVAVPVEDLGHFVREMEAIMQAHGTYANYYAHASAGCLHIRPVISTKGAENVAKLRAISEEVIKLSLTLQGAVSGEHGDGIARSQYLEANFGSEIYAQFRRLKKAADPHNLLNPGKKVDPLPMHTNLRYGEDYTTHTWKPFFDYSSQENLSGAIEMCNGAGVCRKDFGLMCPSFQALREEMHSPRGRSNLLRALISGRLPLEAFGDQAVMEALDLCLACKGCKSECPSGVDVAKLKFDYLYHHYQTHPHKLRDYLFAYIDRLAPLAVPVSGLANSVLGFSWVRRVNQALFGLAEERIFPQFVSPEKKRPLKKHPQPISPDVLFLLDSFSRDFHPETAIHAVQALQHCGLEVQILAVVGAGRPLTSKGFLDQGKAHARKLIDTIRSLDPDGRLPLVGVEPSETFMLRDEYLDYFPDDAYVRALAKRTWLIDEFLIRPDAQGKKRMECFIFPGNNRGKVLLHGQCVQKVQPPAEDGFPVGAQATIAMLEQAGYQVEMIESGCCGMAGAFGYEAEHYALSMKIGEMAVFPAIREAEEGTIIAAAGTSCRSQIKSGTGRDPVHPVMLVFPIPTITQ